MWTLRLLSEPSWLLPFSENELTFALQCQGQSSCKNEDNLRRSLGMEEEEVEGRMSLCCFSSHSKEGKCQVRALSTEELRAEKRKGGDSLSSPHSRLLPQESTFFLQFLSPQFPGLWNKRPLSLKYWPVIISGSMCLSLQFWLYFSISISFICSILSKSSRSKRPGDLHKLSFPSKWNVTGSTSCKNIHLKSGWFKENNHSSSDDTGITRLDVIWYLILGYIISASFSLL